MPIILVKLAVFVFVSPEGINLNLLGSLHKFFILDLYEYLGDGSVEKRQHRIYSARRSVRTSFTNLPPRISPKSLNF